MFARMAHNPSVAWREGAKALGRKLSLGTKFSIWLGIPNVPAIDTGRMQ
jgi:hypothetical protein